MSLRLTDIVPSLPHLRLSGQNDQWKSFAEIYKPPRHIHMTISWDGIRGGSPSKQQQQLLRCGWTVCAIHPTDWRLYRRSRSISANKLIHRPTCTAPIRSAPLLVGPSLLLSGLNVIISARRFRMDRGRVHSKGPLGRSAIEIERLGRGEIAGDSCRHIFEHLKIETLFHMRCVCPVVAVHLRVCLVDRK